MIFETPQRSNVSSNLLRGDYTIHKQRQKTTSFLDAHTTFKLHWSITRPISKTNIASFDQLEEAIQLHSLLLLLTCVSGVPRHRGSHLLHPGPTNIPNQPGPSWRSLWLRRRVTTPQRPGWGSWIGGLWSPPLSLRPWPEGLLFWQQSRTFWPSL